MRYPTEETDAVCGRCGERKPIEAFSLRLQRRYLDTSRCKACKAECRRIAIENLDLKPTHAEAWKRKPIAKKILDRTRFRARESGIPFNLTVEDIVLPELCPVLGVHFIYGHMDWTYSIDRMIPELGYTKGNVSIISNKANRMKNNGTKEELIRLLAWLERMEDNNGLCPING